MTQTNNDYDLRPRKPAAGGNKQPPPMEPATPETLMDEVSAQLAETGTPHKEFTPGTTIAETPTAPTKTSEVISPAPINFASAREFYKDFYTRPLNKMIEQLQADKIDLLDKVTKLESMVQRLESQLEAQTPKNEEQRTDNAQENTNKGISDSYAAKVKTPGVITLPTAEIRAITARSKAEKKPKKIFMMDESDVENEDQWTQVQPKKQKQPKATQETAKLVKPAPIDILKGPKQQDYTNLCRKPTDPNDFIIHKLHARINLARQVRVEPPGKRAKMMWKILNAWGLRGKVIDFSLIGKSVLELYVYRINKDIATKILAEREIEATEDFKLNENLYGKATLDDCKRSIIQRLGFFVYRNAEKPNLIASALAGHGNDIQKAAVDKANEIREEREAKKASFSGEVISC